MAKLAATLVANAMASGVRVYHGCNENTHGIYVPNGSFDS